MSILIDNIETFCHCARLLAYLEKDLLDGRVQQGERERLVEHFRFYSLKEKLDRGIVLVTGKKNEAFMSSWPDSGHRPIKHLAAHLRHQHIANDNIEAGLHDFSQALNTAW